jgi:hypothetical protein
MMKNRFKRSLTIMLMVLIAIVSAFAIVHAADSVVDTVVQGVDFSKVAESILSILYAAVSSFVLILLNLARKKFGINISSDTEKWVQSQAEHAVQYVEELAMKQYKYNNVNVTHNAQMNTAITWLVTKVPTLSREQAGIYINAALARIPGLGATGSSSLVVGGDAGSVAVPEVK